MYHFVKSDQDYIAHSNNSFLHRKCTGTQFLADVNISTNLNTFNFWASLLFLMPLSYSGASVLFNTMNPFMA